MAFVGEVLQGEGGSYATPLGITWSLEEQVDGFVVNTLLTEPGVLIGRALFANPDRISARR